MAHNAKRGRAVTNAAVGVPAQHADTSFDGTGIVIQGIALRHLSYSEIAPDPHAAASQSTMPPDSVKIDLNGRLNIHQAGAEAAVVELVFSGTITPLPLVKPLVIRAVFSAIFAAGRPDVDLGALLTFANDKGGSAIVPYLREVVSAISMRGVYDPVILNPLTVGPLVPHREIERLLREYDEKTAAVAAPPAG